MTDSDHAAHETRAPYEVARVVAFVDAVVAIAMTLLILPLMESVSEAAASDDDAAHWFAEHDAQLTSFVISFVIIALFWMIHHRLFVHVEHATQALLWVLMAWLLTIVWLPVATAISGQMPGEDPLTKVVYIGSMIATCLTSLAIRLYLRQHPSLHRIPSSTITAGIAADVATATLFAIALVVAVAVPAIGYWALFIMLLAGPVQALFARMLGASRGRTT